MGNPLDVIDAFRSLRVAVIGDAMLDVYLEGLVDRVCREAPVPVVSIENHTNAPGGAANTAVNVKSLGAEVLFFSVVGSDVEGLLLKEAVEGRHVNTEHLLVSPERVSLSKHRIISSCQIMLRYDKGTTDMLDAAIESRLIESISGCYRNLDAVVISDYGYGVMTPRVIEAIRSLQLRHPCLLVVDAKHLSLYRHLNVTAVKPNYDETVRLLGIKGSISTEQIAAYGEEILELTGARVAAVTLDSKGAIFFEHGNEPYRTYAHPAKQARATGAGDTFVSALTLALGVGVSTDIAAELASGAAAVVVGKDGTTSCSAPELREYFSSEAKVVRGPDRLEDRVRLYRQQGKRVVFTNGCFDILHRGHITYLSQAKALGDILIVGVNSDASVQRLKGADRPINTLEDRIEVLAALSSIDCIAAFDGDTPVELIRAIRPDVFVKGGDYRVETLPEAPIAGALGAEIRILPYLESRSTTNIIGRLRETGSLMQDAMREGLGWRQG